MIRKIGVAGLFAGLLLGLPSLLRGETVELKLHKLSDDGEYRSEDQMLRMTMPQGFSIQEGRTISGGDRAGFESMVKKEPKYQCKSPFKCVAQLGSNRYAFVLDSTNAKTKGYDRLYFDRDRNGDLTNEEPIKATRSSQSGFSDSNQNRSFPQQELEIEAGGVKYKAAFTITVYSNMKPDGQVQYAFAQLQNSTCREGRLTIDGKSHRIFLLDYNSNGRFDDLFQIDDKEMLVVNRDEMYPQTGDMVLIDPVAAKDTYGGYGPTDSPDRQYLSKLLSLDGKYYTVKVTPAGDRITVEPAKLPMGALVNSNGPYRAVVAGKQGMIKLTGEKDKPVPVPAGQWRLLEYQIDLPSASVSKSASQPASAPAPKKKKSLSERLASVFGGDDAESLVSVEDRGPKLTLVSARATTKTKPVDVAEGKTQTLAFGPPYRATVVVNYFNPEDKEARLELKLLGVANEICGNMMVKGQRPSEPTFKILDKAGELVKKGKFEFG